MHMIMKSAAMNDMYVPPRVDSLHSYPPYQLQ